MSRWRGPMVFGIPVFLLAVGALVVVKTWPGLAEPPLVRGASGDPDEPAGRDGFATDRPPTGREPFAFDADRAFKDLQTICDIGPRVSGSDGMAKQQALLKAHFESLGAVVTMQRFTARQESRREPVGMANMIVSWHPQAPRRVILCSHYDTRPIADQEPDRGRWTRPFLSANDGGSGVALLMELGRQMKAQTLPVGVDFVFFDGEEYIFDPDPGRDRYFFGSEYFAQEYRSHPPKHHYEAALLFDMIGGKHSRFLIERNSFAHAGRVVESVWRIAADLKCEAFRNQFGYEVRDDHLALNRVGIPAADIIDFDYPHWHRLSDTPANCSGESMAEVARVVSVWLQQR